MRPIQIAALVGVVALVTGCDPTTTTTAVGQVLKLDLDLTQLVPLGLAIGVGLGIAQFVQHRLFGHDDDDEKTASTPPSYKYRLIVERPEGSNSGFTEQQRDFTTTFELREGMSLQIADGVSARITDIAVLLAPEEDAAPVHVRFVFEDPDDYESLDSDGDWDGY